MYQDNIKTGEYAEKIIPTLAERAIDSQVDPDLLDRLAAIGTKTRSPPRIRFCKALKRADDVAINGMLCLPDGNGGGCGICGGLGGGLLESSGKNVKESDGAWNHLGDLFGCKGRGLVAQPAQ